MFLKRLLNEIDYYLSLDGVFVFHSSLKASALAVAFALSPVSFSYANSDTTDITIKQQPLSNALTELAKKHHIQIFVRDSYVKGLQAPQVKDASSIKEAITQVLKNSSLQAIWQTDNRVVITKKFVSMRQVEKEIKTQSYVAVETLPEIENVLVQGNILNRYRNIDALSTLRSDVDLLDLSRSVQVINRNFIDDIDVVRFEDALQYVSGTAPRRRLGGADTQYYIRGFREQYTYRNGQREEFRAQVNMNTVETIEVLKGPASVLFGVNSPGGIVNYTTKKPQDDTINSLKIRLDEHGHREFISDFAGAMNDNASYRLIAAAEDSETFRKNSDRSSYTFAPSVTFTLSEQTQLSAAIEKHHMDIPVDRGNYMDLRVDYFKMLDVPIENVTHEPGDNVVDDKLMADINLKHEINLDWRLDFSVGYQKWKNHRKEAQVWDLYLEEGFYDLDSGSFYKTKEGLEDLDLIPVKFGDASRQTMGYHDQELESKRGSLVLMGEFDGIGGDHKLTVGVDYANFDSTGHFLWGDRQGSQKFPTLFNLFEPVYGEFDYDLAIDSDEIAKSKTWGVFVSNTFYLGDDLIINGGLRYNDFYKEESDNWGWHDEFDDTAIVWNFGALYKVQPSLSLYASVATSYQPNDGADKFSGELKASEGKQWELGMKGLAFDGQFEYSLVYFDITKSNIPTKLNDQNNDRFVRFIGEQQSRGIEMDANLQATPSMMLQFNLAYTDAEVTKDLAHPDWVGHTPEGIPKTSASMLINYQFDKTIAGLSGYIGLNYQDEVPNDEDNRIFIPGHTKVDIGVKYDIQLNQGQLLGIKSGFKNVTDESIYIQNGYDQVNIGDIRTFYTNFELQF